MAKKKKHNLNDVLLEGILKWEEATGKSFLQYLDETPALKDLAMLYEFTYGKKPKEFKDLLTFKIKLTQILAQSFMEASEMLTEEEKFLLETISKSEERSNANNNIVDITDIIEQSR